MGIISFSICSRNDPAAIGEFDSMPSYAERGSMEGAEVSHVDLIMRGRHDRSNSQSCTVRITSYVHDGNRPRRFTKNDGEYPPVTAFRDRQLSEGAERLAGTYPYTLRSEAPKRIASTSSCMT